MRRFKGSFTIEAAFLSSFLIFLTVFIMFMAFSMYDRVRLTYVLQETILWARNEAADGSWPDRERIRSEAIRRQGRMLVTEPVNYSVTIHGDQITIFCEGHSVIWQPAAVLLNRFDQAKQYWIWKGSGRKFRPEDALRIAGYFKEGVLGWKSDINGS